MTTKLKGFQVETGTGPGAVVKLDGSSRLPAVDGSQLLNLPGGDGGSPLPLYNIVEDLTPTLGGNLVTTDSYQLQNRETSPHSTVLVGRQIYMDTSGDIRLHNTSNNMNISCDTGFMKITTGVAHTNPKIGVIQLDGNEGIQINTGLAGSPAAEVTADVILDNLHSSDPAVIQLGSGTTAFRTSISAHASLAGNNSFVLPADNGTVDYVLRTDGSGNTSWVAQTGGGGSPVTTVNNWLTANNGSDFGTAPTATGYNSIALGFNANAGATAGALVIGTNATSDAFSTVVGYGCTSNGYDNNVAIGQYAQCNSAFQVTIGTGVYNGTSNYQTAIGYGGYEALGANSAYQGVLTITKGTVKLYGESAQFVAPNAPGGSPAVLPVTPETGGLIYDTNINTVKDYDGANWNSVGRDLGEFTVANLPAASLYPNCGALATNASGGRTIVRSDGTNWKVVAVEGATVTT